MKVLAAVLLGLGWLCLAVPVVAQSPTATPTSSATLTPSQTPNSAQRAALATLVPPSNCGLPYHPCGPVPWAVPMFPTVALPSPTIKPTLPSPTPLPITATASATLTLTGTLPTSTPILTLQPEGTALIDVSAASTLVGNVQHMIATLSSQHMTAIEIDGTPVALTDIFSQLGQQVGESFSVVRTVQALMRELGTVGSLVTFAFVALLLVILIKLGATFVPIILMLARLILQFIQTIKP